MLGRKKATRTQMVLGSAAITALAIGGLAFTASGTQAAGRVRAGVEEATGIEMAATPPLPPATRHVVADRQRGRATKVTVTTDGRTATYTGAAADAYLAAHPTPPAPPIPPVPSVPPLPPVPPMPDVPAVGPVPPVPPMPPVPEMTAEQAGLHRHAAELGREAAVEGARLQRQAAALQRQAARLDTARIRRDAALIRRQSLRAALTGLQGARSGMLTNADIPEAHRAEALAGIDQAIARLRTRIAAQD